MGAQISAAMGAHGGGGGGGPTADDERRRIVALFREGVASGDRRPVLLLQSVVWSFVLPILYLSIPHTKRPWLYRARFAVLAVMAVFSAESAMHSSSTNLAVGYGTGLAVGWCMIGGFACLVFSRPQFEAERVEKRPRPRPMSPHRRTSSDGGSPLSPPPSPLRNHHASAIATGATGHGHGNCNGCVNANGHGNGNANGNGSVVRQRRRKSVRFLVPPDEDVAKTLVEHEYYWQAFPADAPFLTRLDWAFDYYTAWRGSGWNRAIPTIPKFASPQKPLSGELVKIESISLASSAGCVRYATYRQFLAARLRSIALGYLVLDLCAVVMTWTLRDPYFIIGPYSTTDPSRPEHADLPHNTLPRYLARQLLGFAGMLAALEMILSLVQLARHFAASRRRLPFGNGVRAELWQFPSIFGSFAQVFDHGLVGFWGRFWHQSFRLGFTAPGYWLARQGLIPSPDHTVLGKAVVSFFAFLSSGLLHASGSYTAVRPTRPWMPLAFFMLSWVGIMVQTGATALLRRCYCYYVAGAGTKAAPVPVLLRKGANFCFTSVWLLSTCWLIVDDLTAAGLWLYEPVPFSVFRAMGLGAPGDSAWRWGGGGLGEWHVDRWWWNSGIGI